MAEENWIGNISFVSGIDSSLETEFHVINLYGFSLYLYNLLQKATE